MGRFDNWLIFKISDLRLEELLNATYRAKVIFFDSISKIRAKDEGDASHDEWKFQWYGDLFYALLELNYYRRLLREKNKIRPLPLTPRDELFQAIFDLEREQEE